MTRLFRKKPVEVEAMRWPTDDECGYAAVCRRADIHRWVWRNGGRTWVVTPKANPSDVHVTLQTLEDDKRIGSGDRCEPDIFEQTYYPLGE